MSLTIRDFGKTTAGKPVRVAILKNARLEAHVLSFGAILANLIVPDKSGTPIDVVLGYPTVEAYELNHDSMGVVVGRFANRIGGSKFALGGQVYHVTPNENGNCLHSGLHGFNHTLFAMAPIPGDDDSVSLTADSADGTDGFPGNVHLEVQYALTGSGLVIRYYATTDVPTVINITNHSYFNLNGHASGSVLGAPALAGKPCLPGNRRGLHPYRA
jgi:aldose 1-epimerase